MPLSPAIQTNQLRKVFGENAAVKSLTLQVEQGEVFGFLGPNGAGKTTSIKMLLGLIRATSGSAMLLGAPSGDRAALARIGFLPEHFRFQEWLNAAEFLELHGQLLNMEARDLKLRTDELLERVGLSDFRNKQLRTFSKGMLQRIGLAQALLNRPALVILDEPTSGLDVSVQASVLKLFRSLQDTFALTYVFISHDLAVVRAMCARIAVMYLGRIVELGETSTVFEQPRHPYTRSLLAAVPRIGGRRVTLDFDLPGEPPNPRDVPSGCRFRTRCPLVQDVCAAEEPTLRDVEGRQVACHFA
jgi:oligopeptide/dipeptide ABC transporter ATP-binding protein